MFMAIVTLFLSVFCYRSPFLVQFWVVHLPRCTGIYFTTNCFATLLQTFFPSFPSQAVVCFLSSTSHGHLFHGIFCYEFPFWVQIWVVHLPRCMGVYFTTNCFGTLFWTFFPSFPSQAVECFYQVLLLDIFTVGLSFFLMLGKFACLWPF